MKRSFLLLLGIGLVLQAGQARAQWWDRPYYGGFHASTPAEGYARGMADIIRSAGMANLLDAQAASVGQEARTKAINNDLLATETYFNKRAVNSAYRYVTRRAPLTSDQIASLSRSRAPDPLHSSQFDPVSGEIQWPTVLTGDVYARYRAKLEDLFAQQASMGGSPTLAQAGQIRDLTDGLAATLRSNIRDYPANAYLEARNFVNSLAFEGRIQ